MTETFIKHCVKFYNTLDDRATDKEVNGRIVRIFAGSYTEAWKASGVAQTYYSPVRKALERHEAIVVLQRGTNQADTVIHLRGLPDEWDVAGWRNDSRLTSAGIAATILADVQEIKSKLGGINILEALQEVERRLNELDEKFESLNRKTHKKKTTQGE